MFNRAPLGAAAAGPPCPLQERYGGDTTDANDSVHSDCTGVSSVMCSTLPVRGNVCDNVATHTDKPSSRTSSSSQTDAPPTSNAAVTITVNCTNNNDVCRTACHSHGSRAAQSPTTQDTGSETTHDVHDTPHDPPTPMDDAASVLTNYELPVEQPSELHEESLHVCSGEESGHIDDSTLPKTSYSVLDGAVGSDFNLWAC